MLDRIKAWPSTLGGTSAGLLAERVYTEVLGCSSDWRDWRRILLLAVPIIAGGAYKPAGKKERP